MLNEDIIEVSKSDWCSRPVIVKKANGNFRFCIDYRYLNKVTEEDAYPMKNVNTVLDKLRKAKYISKIDLKQAFMQILVAEASRKYTAFGVQDAGLFAVSLAQGTSYRLLKRNFWRSSIVSEACI